MELSKILNFNKKVEIKENCLDYSLMNLLNDEFKKLLKID